MFRPICQTYCVTLMISLAALSAYAVPSLSQWLQLDFAAVGEGEWWRIWTGHLTHFDGNHLFWDLLMFVVLGSACERQHPRRFGLAIILMLPVISAVVAAVCPQITVYRGLSGIDTALFTWFVADQGRQCRQAGDRRGVALWLGLACALTGKLLFESVSGQTLFVDAGNFKPLVESHLAGAAVGLLGSVLLHHGNGVFATAGERGSTCDLPATAPRPRR